ncbi:hypothetical protein MMC12_001107 [Toensbergia leucococca]|nr:hypothetical protein [Toensbergia leucococca]
MSPMKYVLASPSKTKIFKEYTKTKTVQGEISKEITIELSSTENLTPNYPEAVELDRGKERIPDSSDDSVDSNDGRSPGSDDSASSNGHSHKDEEEFLARSQNRARTGDDSDYKQGKEFS